MMHIRYINTQLKSDWMFNTQNRVLQSDWLILEDNETLNINMPDYKHAVLPSAAASMCDMHAA